MSSNQRNCNQQNFLQLLQLPLKQPRQLQREQKRELRSTSEQEKIRQRQMQDNHQGVAPQKFYTIVAITPTFMMLAVLKSKRTTAILKMKICMEEVTSKDFRQISREKSTRSLIKTKSLLSEDLDLKLQRLQHWKRTQNQLCKLLLQLKKRRNQLKPCRK